MANTDRVVKRIGAWSLLAICLAALGCDGAPLTGPTPVARRMATFAFTLPAGSRGSYVVGPVLAGAGQMVVDLDFSGDFIIVACVGTRLACRPMGGRPMIASFNIPADFPAGPIQAEVYFNSDRPQPPGDASGTVAFTYSPL